MRQSLSVLLFVLLAVSTVHAQAAFVVPNAAYPTIQSAINASSPNDLIVVWPGTYYENIVWPSHDIRLEGAGIGQSIIDGSFIDPCVQFRGASSSASELKGFTLRHGRGLQSNYGTLATAGGGIHLIDDSSGVPQPTIRQCEISNCHAEQAAAIYMWNVGNVVFEDMLIQHNVEVALPPGVNQVSAIDISEANSSPTFRRCLIQGNNSSSAFSQSSLIRVRAGASVFLSKSIIQKNKINGALLRVTAANVVSVTQCNVTVNFLAGTYMDGFANGISIRECLVTKNTGGSGFLFNSPTEIVGCTIADNYMVTGSPSPSVALIWGIPIDVRNTIIWNNTDFLGNFITVPVQGVAQIDHCNIQFSGGTGPGGIDSDPKFMEPAAGDYLIAPDSPCLDAGNSTPVGGLSLEDYRGLPRLRLAAVDIGCFEGQAMAYHPAAAGRVGEAAGGPYDVLQVNGSSGNKLREVVVPVGTASTVSMLQPPSAAVPLGFAIFGFIGEATLDSVTNVPLGIGDMSFAPEPLVPAPFLPSYFTFTNNLTPVPQLIASTPTPWISPLGQPIPFPLTITFQGVVQEPLGVLSPTNAVIYRLQ